MSHHSKHWNTFCSFPCLNKQGLHGSFAATAAEGLANFLRQMSWEASEVSPTISGKLQAMMKNKVGFKWLVSCCHPIQSPIISHPNPKRATSLQRGRHLEGAWGIPVPYQLLIGAPSGSYPVKETRKYIWLVVLTILKNISQLEG